MDFSVHNAIHWSKKGSVYGELLPTITTVEVGKETEEASW